MRFVLVAFLSAVFFGCSSGASIVLTVDGDFDPGSEIDNLELSTWIEGAQIWSERHRLSVADQLPRTYRIAPTSSEELTVELSVVGALSGSAVVDARRRVSFVTGEAVPVAICLWRRCVEADLPGCSLGSCDEGGGDGDADADADDGGNVDAGDDGGGPDGDGATPETDVEGEILCSDSCALAPDGLCEDGGPLAENYLCEFGSDCADCGPRYRDDCVPRDCSYRQCGSDGCGGSCGSGCVPPERCMPGGQCIEWVTVEGERFEMGSAEAEVGRDDDETLHLVTLTNDFEMTATEVTQRWFRGLYGWVPSASAECGDDCPVEALSWNAAATFVRLLSFMEGVTPCYRCSGVGLDCDLYPGYAAPYACEGYRLPTEAEWELAARGGSASATYNGDLDEAHLGCESPFAVLDAVAWYCGNAAVSYEGGLSCEEMGGPSTCGKHPVGLLEANGLGLHDMLGNLSEWVHDWHGPLTADHALNPSGPPSGTARLYRGGSYYTAGYAVRAAYRNSTLPTEEAASLGFRVVRTLH